MVLIGGVEEAGRGPVIGPMVMCCTVIDEKDEYKLKSIGAKDSKLLTAKTRESLFGQIIGMVKSYKYLVVHPEEIDAALRSPTLNLNLLEAVKSAELINKLMMDKVILDCPSTNRNAYRSYVLNKLDKKIELIAEHKADVNYPIVSAASIIAKVIRDKEVEKLKESLGVDFGSGYPSDEKTKKFLEENWNKYPGLFRETWNPWQVQKRKKAQKGLFDF